MIELRTLGALELSGPEGASCQAVLQQPKRLALLAYLAVSSPRRFHRRDSLLAMFWPDLDQDRARASLRRSLYFLRTALGAGVIAGRGEEEVGIGEATLTSDATAFTELLRAGEPERALALYHGDLLEGFFVASAPEFERWLERERTQLRNEAARAAWLLADRAAEMGDAKAALRFGRRAVDFDPSDDRSIGRFLTLMEQAGDGPGGLRAYAELERRLNDEFELEPSPEIRELVDAMRSREQRAAATRATATRTASPLPIAPNAIAVFPFTVRGDAELVYLRDGMVDLLSTALDGAGDLRTTDPRALLGHLARTGWRDDDPVLAGAVAAQFGAGLYILGSITAAAGRVEATAALHGAGGIRASAHASARGETDIFRLVDDLVRELLAAHSAGPGARLGRLAALTTTSLPALKAYLKGESELRAGRYFDAMDSLQRAVAGDETFALAYYRLAAAAAGSAMPAIAREVADRGYAHRERLSGHDRLLLDAQRAWLHGAVAEAEAHYGTITGTHPDDVEAWFLLGDLLFHSNPLRGRSATEAREPFERAVELERDHVSSLVHLARIAALEQRQDAAAALAEQALAASPGGDQALSLRAFLAAVRADDQALASVVAELQRARAVTVAVAFSEIALYAGNLSAAELLAREFIRAARSDEMRALCHVLLAHLALARGDMDATWAALDAAERLDNVVGLETRALFAALPFVELPQESLKSIRDRVERWDASSAPTSSFLVFAMHNGLHPHIRLYLLALLDARLCDVAGATRWADALAALPNPEPGAVLPAHLCRGARARVARARNEPAQALGELEAGRSEAWFQLTVASPFYSQAYERFLRAELLMELGRRDEAAGWYRSMAERSPYELIYRAPAAAALRGK